VVVTAHIIAVVYCHYDCLIYAEKRREW